MNKSEVIPSIVCLKGIYILGESMASGAFGSVYWGKDYKNIRMVAVKVEKRSPTEAGFLDKESEILTTLCQAASGEPILRHYDYGETPDFRYMIMELGGMNLRELKKETRTDQFRVDTTLFIAKKMVEALQLVHEMGWVHRDVKPANFCIGRGSMGHRKLYIVDFGISRKFMLNGKHIQPRKKCSFRGTLRYSSIRTQQNQETGPVDDLWSVWYVAIENMTGQLPWRRQVSGTEVLNIKLQFMDEKYINNEARNPLYRWMIPPASIISFLQKLAPADYYTQFNYKQIVEEMESDLKSMNFGDESKLEWDCEFVDPNNNET